MPASTKNLIERLETFRARCFWWVAPSVAIADLPRQTLIQELQIHGGRAGMQLAALL